MSSYSIETIWRRLITGFVYLVGFTFFYSCVPEEVRALKIDYNPVTKTIHIDSSADHKAMLKSVHVTTWSRGTCIVSIDSLYGYQYSIRQALEEQCYIHEGDSISITAQVTFPPNDSWYYYMSRSINYSGTNEVPLKLEIH